MNGITFRPFRNLKQVWLYSNECINQRFIDAQEIATLRRTLNDNCPFDESEILKAEIDKIKLQFNDRRSQLLEKSAEVLIKLQQIQELETQLKGKPTTTEIEAWNTTIAGLKAEITECKEELATFKSEVENRKLQCSKQLDSVRNVQENLVSQPNATSVLKTKERSDDLQLKLQENAE